jgi:two-component system NtrC family sensor kinase
MPESGKKILVVDDEDSVRAVCMEMLEQEGFSTDGAASGSDALERLDAGSYDAVVLDVNMPDMDGIDLYKKSVARRPELKGRFIFITGDIYGEIDAIEVFLESAPRVMKKPFGKEDLVRSVRETLAGP